jgi:type VI secretion system secreted protein Hcp
MAGSVDYFLKIDGIPGESTDSKHGKEIDVESWSWSESNGGGSGMGSGHGAGKVTMNDFSFSMRTNKASPKLMLNCANGAHIKDALLTCRKAGKEQQEYLKIKFSDLLVSSYQTGGSRGDVVPMDSITLSFTKVEFTYSPQKPDGTLDSPVVHNYDIKIQKGG